jgi:hypothetical protein
MQAQRIQRKIQEDALLGLSTSAGSTERAACTTLSTLGPSRTVLPLNSTAAAAAVTSGSRSQQGTTRSALNPSGASFSNSSLPTLLPPAQQQQQQLRKPATSVAVDEEFEGPRARIPLGLAAVPSVTAATTVSIYHEYQHDCLQNISRNMLGFRRR